MLVRLQRAQEREAPLPARTRGRCYRVLPHVEGEDALADAIRETSRTVEARLRELGVNVATPPS
jgi:hypothetical protein